MKTTSIARTGTYGRPNYWNENDPLQMCKRLANRLKIKKMGDWYQVTYKDIASKGGRTLLNRYKGSPSAMLQSLYPEHEWNLSMFRRVPLKYSSQLLELDSLELIQKLAGDLHVTKLEDWYRVSFHQFQRVVPLSFFQKRPLEKLLVEAFPEHSWDVGKLRFRKGTMKASQRVLKVMVQAIFPQSGSWDEFFW